MIHRTPHIGLAIVAGGALGTLGRAGVAAALPSDGWPWATLAVNLAGALLLGLLLGAWHQTSAVRLAFLGTGLLGSFTTFSTFAVEVVELADRPVVAAAYAAVSVTAGFALARLGLAAGDRVRREEAVEVAAELAADPGALGEGAP